MADAPRFYLTTAIDYPNSRPHIGTAFEKLGADVQARYRRQEGYDVFFLMGNDENTVKVVKKAAELGQDPKAYCDEMARQFREVWRALEVSYDDFIQTSEKRHHDGCRKFIQEVYVSRIGQNWGIRIPFDEEFTIYVWFDALLNYATAVGYGTDEAKFNKWWPADLHFIGKDITRFHCALWPAMCFAAGIEPPRRVFGHGFVYIKNEETGSVEKISKSLGNVVEPMEIISKFSGEVFRYYFLRECPFPGDGEFSWRRFADVYNADLANNLGNLYSRVVTLISKNYSGHLSATSGVEPGEIYDQTDTEKTVEQVENHIEACQYNQALERIWRQILDPA